jgi:hypothetical protein
MKQLLSEEWLIAIGRYFTKDTWCVMNLRLFSLWLFIASLQRREYTQLNKRIINEWTHVKFKFSMQNTLLVCNYRKKCLFGDLTIEIEQLQFEKIN